MKQTLSTPANPRLSVEKIVNTEHLTDIIITGTRKVAHHKGRITHSPVHSSENTMQWKHNHEHA